MISKSLPSNKRRALVTLLARHAKVFDFAQTVHETLVLSSRTRHKIDTGSTHLLRQKPYRVSASKR